MLNPQNGHTETICWLSAFANELFANILWDWHLKG